jgi:hypothetical protein
MWAAAPKTKRNRSTLKPVDPVTLINIQFLEDEI